MSAPVAADERQDSTLLNQIIAVRAAVKNDTEQKLTKFYHLIQRDQLLKGQSRTYTPRVDDDYVYPAEHQNVIVKADAALREVSADLIRMFDVTAAMDWTNQKAAGDIVLWAGDTPTVLVPNVPVSYLMFLEKALTNLQAVVSKLPTLDPVETWTYDGNADVYKSEPVGTTKTKKVRRSHVLAPATDRHPAQVESYTEDEPVGTWTTVKLSGAVPAEKVHKMQQRIKALMQAVKFARERANMQAVIDPKPGARILDYVLGVDA